MQICILITLCFAVSHGQEIFSEGENELKRGVFPFMAFIYYPDETVVDASGSRFLRSAVLIRPDWLVSSAVGPIKVDGASDSFPRKTLLARLGAVTIDANITLNEDEDEQEREVIQIVRPYNHSSTQWWGTDISLMKTLLPFNMSAAVSVATLNLKRKNNENNCIILVYAKRYGNWTEEKILMQLSVELLPTFIENCGRHFVKNTMICAADSDANKNAIYDSNFCQGNSGGPLICENEVTGLQTYIENSCKQPHLYQHLSAWDNFMSCGAEDKCQEEQCANICIVSYKDGPPQLTGTVAAFQTEEAKIDLEHAQTTEFIESMMTRTTSALPDVSIEDSELAVTPLVTAVITTTEQKTTRTHLVATSTKSTASAKDLPKGNIAEPKSWPNEKYKEERKKLELDDGEIDHQANVAAHQQDIKINVQKVAQNNKGDIAEPKSWPNEKYKEERKKLELDGGEIDRQANVEAQKQDIKVKVHNMAQRNMCMIQSLFFGSFVLACLK